MGPRAACPPTSAIEPTFAAHRLFLRGPYGPVVTGMTAWQAAGPKAFPLPAGGEVAERSEVGGGVQPSLPSTVPTHANQWL